MNAPPMNAIDKPQSIARTPETGGMDIIYLDDIMKSVGINEADTGQYKGYIVDPQQTLSYHLGRNQFQWRPSEQELFTLVSGSILLTAIHEKRKQQIKRMTAYREWDDKLGWRIVHKDYASPKFKAPADAKQKIAQLRSLFERPHYDPIIGNTFLSLVTKAVELDLTVDKVPVGFLKRGQKITGMAIYDPRTIRPILEVVWKYYEQQKTDSYAVTPLTVIEKEAERYRSILNADLRECSWVQYVNTQLVGAWTDADMVVGRFNPSAKMDRVGMGYSRVEAAVLSLDAWLKAWGFNTNQFTSGMSLLKGILAILGGAASDQQVQDLKAQFVAQVRGVQNAGRIPIIGLRGDKGMQYIRFDGTNKEMEFMQWLDLCSSIVCAVYAMDPRELNLASRSQAFSGSLISHNNDEALTQTKDEGLNCLLLELEQLFNEIIHRVGHEFSDYRFIWTGLDKQATEKERSDTLASKKWMTLNEKRMADNLDPLKGVATIEFDGEQVDLCEIPEQLIDPLLRGIQQHDQELMQQSMMGGGAGGEEQEQAPEETGETQGKFAKAYSSGPVAGKRRTIRIVVKTGGND